MCLIYNNLIESIKLLQVFEKCKKCSILSLVGGYEDKLKIQDIEASKNQVFAVWNRKSLCSSMHILSQCDIEEYYNCDTFFN